MRVNISIPEALHTEAKKYSLNVSAICRDALIAAILEEWAFREESKLRSMLEEKE